MEGTEGSVRNPRGGSRRGERGLRQKMVGRVLLRCRGMRKLRKGKRKLSWVLWGRAERRKAWG